MYANAASDPIPGFKRLEMRSEFGYESFVLVFCVLVIVGIWIALCKGLGNGLGIAVAIILTGTVGPSIALGLIHGCIPATAVPLEYWSYVRSFRTTKRRQNGIV